MLWYGTITYKYVLYVNSCRKHKKIGAIIVRKSDAKKNIYVLSLSTAFTIYNKFFSNLELGEKTFIRFFFASDWLQNLNVKGVPEL